VAFDNRSSSLSNLSPSSAGSSPSGDRRAQTAAFDIGALRLELKAAPGATRLVIAGDGTRDSYVVDPLALASWAGMAIKLLDLKPASRREERVEFRTPFLVDREGRSSIAFEGLVAEDGVMYRLLVTGASARIAGIMTTRDVVHGVAEAAAGAVLVARHGG
jgi:hypothetical protein